MTILFFSVFFIFSPFFFPSAIRQGRPASAPVKGDEKKSCFFLEHSAFENGKTGGGGQRLTAQTGRDERASSAKRQAVWFGARNVSNGKCSNASPFRPTGRFVRQSTSSRRGNAPPSSVTGNKKGRHKAARRGRGKRRETRRTQDSRQASPPCLRLCPCVMKCTCSATLTARRQMRDRLCTTRI